MTGSSGDGERSWGVKMPSVSNQMPTSFVTAETPESRLRRLILKGDGAVVLSGCKRRPVLSPADSAVLLALLDHPKRLATRQSRLVVLAGVHLWSAVERNEDWSKDRMATWRVSVVDFVLAEPTEGRAQVLVMPVGTDDWVLDWISDQGLVCLVRDPARSPEGEANLIWSSIPARPLAGAKNLSESQLVTTAWAREALGILPAALADPRFITHAQRRLEGNERLKALRYLEDQHWYLLEEVALQRLINTEAAETGEFGDANWCAQNLNLDMLLVRIDAERGSWPLVAIEFDGKQHDSAEQQLKDVRKNVILKKLGVTLLRVNYRQMPEAHRFDAAASEPLRRVVAALAVRASRRLIERQEASEHALDRIQTVDPLARTTYGKSWVDLDDDDKDDVLTMAQAADAGLLPPSEDHGAEDDADRQAWLSRLGVQEEALLDLQVTYRPEEGWSARATYVTPARTELALVSPALFLGIPRANPADVAALARSLLRDMLLEQAHRAMNPV